MAYELCRECANRIPWHRHDGFCSKKCEIDHEKKKEEELEIKKRIGLNAIPIKQIENNKISRILAIGDCHFPFGHIGVFEAIFKRISIFKPDIVIQLGDLYDFYSFSRFPKSSNLMTPRQELEIGRDDAEIFWSEVHSIVPESKKIQILGNHCTRHIKRVIENCPDIEDMFKGMDNFTFPHVETVYDEREIVILKDIQFTHGHRKHGTHALEFMQNTVVGHTHTGGVVMHKFGKRMFWELNAGYCADPNQKPLQYTPKKWDRWTHGWAEIDEYGPRFCPYHGK